MNHASTTSDGARHIDAFIDALARRHRRLARMTLLTRAAAGGRADLGGGRRCVVPRRRASPPSAQTMLVAAALAASVAAAVLAWRQQGPPPTRARLARLAEDRLSGLDDRLATAVDVLERRSQVADGPLTQLLLDDTARRVSRRRPRTGGLVGHDARRDVPGGGRGRRAGRAGVCRTRAGRACRPRGPAVGVSGTAGPRGEPR